MFLSIHPWPSRSNPVILKSFMQVIQTFKTCGKIKLEKIIGSGAGITMKAIFRSRYGLHADFPIFSYNFFLINIIHFALRIK